MSSKLRKSLKILTRVSYIFGVLLVLSATMLSFINFPVSAEWNKGSLSFRGSCGGNCSIIKVQICNDGSGNMDQTTAFEVYYSVSGNPKNGNVVGGGTVPALASGQCASLEYNPNGQAGNYMFKAYQPIDHPGQSELWSGACTVGPCQVPTNTPVSPTNTPVTPTNTPVTPTPQDPTPTSVTPTNTPVTPTPQEPTPTSVSSTPVTENTPVSTTTQVPTLPPPVVKDTPTVLIPVTGADFSGTNGGNPSQRIAFNFGLGLIGFGMVLQGFRTKFHL